MPSLMVLSRTRAYPGVRMALASAGAVLAAAWLAERTTLIASNPLNGVADVLIAHPFAIAGALAVGAVVSWAVPRLRAEDEPCEQSTASSLREESLLTGP